MKPSPRGPLAGIRVLDMSQFIPGPYATLLLADLGADVVKVEPPGGDPQRIDGPLDRDGISAWYKLINRNKTIVQIDLKSAVGKGDVDALLAQADVLLESYRPGVLSRLGYDAARLALLNPRLVHCALSGYGQNGPYRLRAGHDINYQAMTGILDITGTANQPTTSNPPIADYVGALHAYGLIAAALFARERTGRGSHIDLAMTDAALGLMATDLTAMQRPEFDPRRGIGPYAGGWACYNIYATADGGHVTLGALEPKFWASFCQAVGEPGWIARQDEPRPQNALIREVAALFVQHTRQHWCELLDPVETCFEAVLGLDEVPAHPQNQARRMIQEIDEGTVDVLLPAWIDRQPPPPRDRYRMATATAVLARWQDRPVSTS